MKIVLSVLSFLIALCAFANVPHGAPGLVHSWSSAQKIQVGTSRSDESLVWFTNAQGILTEVFYPTIDRAQIKDSQILITDNKSFFLEEKTGLNHQVEVISPSLVKQINTDKLNRFSISHTFFTLNSHNILIDEIEVTSNIDGLSFYLLVNPAMNNTGMSDNAHVHRDHLSFHEGESRLEVKTTIGFSQMSVGYVGFSDGYQDLHRDFKMDWQFKTANSGNVAGLAKFKVPALKGKYKFYVIYSFDGQVSAMSSLTLDVAKKNYENAWRKYFNSLKKIDGLNAKHSLLYWRSIFAIKVMEDKLNKGAMIASLSKPWGDTVYENPGVFTGGYHLIWPRDLYHVCTALIEAGDYESPINALEFLRKIQYQDADDKWDFGSRIIPKKGAFPQNVWTSGEEYWQGLQIDQTAYPVLLFNRLITLSQGETRELLLNRYSKMAKDALDFIKNYGPWSQQERWEENFGISPSSFAASAAALFVGEKLFPGRGYYETAKAWLTKPGDNIHTWTFTETGVYGDGRYYLRVAGCADILGVWDPNANVACHVSNLDNFKINQKEMVDPGFLQLALLGVLPASDERLKKSLEIIDQTIKVETPHGPGWYRYKFDAYGEEKKGRLWPLLSGEQARYYIERYRQNDLNVLELKNILNPIFDSFVGFANAGGMLPEQVWESTGEGTGGATPLAWTHAEYIRLLWSLKHGRNVENQLEDLSL